MGVLVLAQGGVGGGGLWVPCKLMAPVNQLWTACHTWNNTLRTQPLSQSLSTAFVFLSNVQSPALQCSAPKIQKGGGCGGPCSSSLHSSCLLPDGEGGGLWVPCKLMAPVNQLWTACHTWNNTLRTQPLSQSLSTAFVFLSNVQSPALQCSAPKIQKGGGCGGPCSSLLHSSCLVSDGEGEGVWVEAPMGGWPPVNLCCWCGCLKVTQHGPWPWVS